MRNVLERLGPPEEIAAAAGAGTLAPERGRLETAAMVVLAVSFVLPFVGYLIGAGLVLASKAWDGQDKAIALLIPPLVVAVGGLVVLAGRRASPKASRSTPVSARSRSRSCSPTSSRA